jgi:DNA-binding response OmpR family regulator
MAKKFRFPVVPLSEIAQKGLTPQMNPVLPVVLIVDDESLIADTLAAILARSGYAALTAYDGMSALEIAQTIPPQMVITDVYMPGMNGIDLAIAIREACPDCKVLLFSGQASTMDLLASARNAGHEFSVLTKPIHPTELLARISECLNSSRTVERDNSWPASVTRFQAQA